MTYTPDSESYIRHREKMAERQRESRAKAAEIGPLPEVVDPSRKAACGESLRLFCETYSQEAFNLGWSKDHLRILDRFEVTVRDGGLFCLAMPRGSGKTTIAIRAALWALLYGYRKWTCLIGATGPKAKSLLKSIKTLLRDPQSKLAEDFPEVCWPIIKLENKAIRAASQTLDGRSTNMEWLDESIMFPTVEGSAASGAIITVAGLEADIRGQQRTVWGGRVIRPDLVIGDDPQTRESAKSRQQTDDRMATIQGDVLGLAGPDVKISGVFPVTVIRRGDLADRLLDREESPDFHGERTQLVYGWPKNFNLWTQYQEIRQNDLRNGGNGSAATEFYADNFDAMNEGVSAAWDERKFPEQLSGVEYAMCLYFRDEAAFAAEYQNEPIETGDDDTLSEDALAKRANVYKRGEVPPETERVTAFIDVQKHLLYYVVAAWRADFTGWILDYGAFPDQGTANFRYANARKTTTKLWPGQPLEVTLQRALTECVNGLCDKTWKTAEGHEYAIEKLLIDANWGLSRNIVYSFVRSSKHRNIVMPSHGKGVGASSEPLNAKHVRKLGRQVGLHWRVDRAKDTPNRHVIYDTNFWKSFLFSRFATEPGTPGSLTLYQGTHPHFARHCKAEYPVRVEGRGRIVDEWKVRPDQADNHWFDCAVGNCVAASMLGVKVNAPSSQKFAEREASKRKKKKRPRFQEF